MQTSKHEPERLAFLPVTHFYNKHCVSKQASIYNMMIRVSIAQIAKPITSKEALGILYYFYIIKFEIYNTYIIHSEIIVIYNVKRNNN